MLNFFKEFTNFCENKRLSIKLFNKFKDEIRNRIITTGSIVIHPGDEQFLYIWNIKKYNDRKINFTPENKSPFHRNDFHNFLLTLLRGYGVLSLLLKVNTGNYYHQKEILELWSYRIILMDNNAVIVEPVSSKELYNLYTNDFKTNEKMIPDSNMVYCGPDGKIAGWDFEEK